MTDERRVAETGAEAGEPWFHDARIVDSEWVEFSVTTSRGDTVRYRVPRRTTFEGIDEAA